MQQPLATTTVVLALGSVPVHAANRAGGAVENTVLLAVTLRVIFRGPCSQRVRLSVDARSEQEDLVLAFEVDVRASESAPDTIPSPDVLLATIDEHMLRLVVSRISSARGRHVRRLLLQVLENPLGAQVPTQSLTVAFREVAMPGPPRREGNVFLQ